MSGSVLECLVGIFFDMFVINMVCYCMFIVWFVICLSNWGFESFLIFRFFLGILTFFDYIFLA